jgi:hypothetical protein
LFGGRVINISSAFASLRLTELIDAIAAHDRFAGHEKFGTRENDRDVIVEELTHIACQLETGFVKMRAEPNIERRRQMAVAVGPWVSKLDDAFARSLEDFSPESRAFTKFGTDRIIGEAVGHLLWLCQWELND